MPIYEKGDVACRQNADQEAFDAASDEDKKILGVAGGCQKAFELLSTDMNMCWVVDSCPELTRTDEPDAARCAADPYITGSEVVVEARS